VPGKHGAPAPAYSVVYVTLPDRPGQLARLFTDAGESGVNIEDFRIDHDPGRPVGLAEVVVGEQAAATLVHALSERGWSVSQ
jgi:prephenate dehydrogenase